MSKSVPKWGNRNLNWKPRETEKDKGIPFSSDNKSVHDFVDADTRVISRGYGHYFKPYLVVNLHRFFLIPQGQAFSVVVSPMYPDDGNNVKWSLNKIWNTRLLLSVEMQSYSTGDKFFNSWVQPTYKKPNMFFCSYSVVYLLQTEWNQIFTMWHTVCCNLKWRRLLCSARSTVVRWESVMLRVKWS